MTNTDITQMKYQMSKTILSPPPQPINNLDRCEGVIAKQPNHLIIKIIQIHVGNVHERFTRCRFDIGTLSKVGHCWSDIGSMPHGCINILSRGP